MITRNVNSIGVSKFVKSFIAAMICYGDLIGAKLLSDSSPEIMASAIDPAQ